MDLGMFEIGVLLLFVCIAVVYISVVMARH